MTLVQELDARGRPLVIPALAVTGASLDIRSDGGPSCWRAWGGSGTR